MSADPNIHTEILERIRRQLGQERWQAVPSIIDTYALYRSERDRKITAAGIHYFLLASTWYD
ncbi:hypothetical protein [Synechococcus elongatus]|uniref:hypothetical protein n=1 Tax=Synechococcus elongatus TaxID=32046 RepID=UPI000F7E7BB2|nr:hypothetical protein [Synechococcus elongatus]